VTIRDDSVPDVRTLGTMTADLLVFRQFQRFRDDWPREGKKGCRALDARRHLPRPRPVRPLCGPRSDWFQERRRDAHARRFTRQIEALGYRVSIEPAEAA